MDKQNGLAPILIVLLIALAVGGYLLYQKQTKPVIVPQVIQPAPSPVASSGATGSAETINWKTYTNAKYGYSIMYPDTWIINESDSNGTNILGMGKGSKSGFLYGGQSILIEVASDDLTNLAYIKVNIAPTSNPLKNGNTSLGGLTGEKWSFNNDNNSDNYAIFFSKTGKRFVVIKELSNKSQFKEYDSEIDQILSTFRFD